MRKFSSICRAFSLALGMGLVAQSAQVAQGAATLRLFDIESGLAVNPDNPGGARIAPSLGLPAATVFNVNLDDPMWHLNAPVGSEPVFVEGRSGLPDDLAVYFDGTRPDMEAVPSAQNPPTQLSGMKLCAWCPDADSQDLIIDESDGDYSETFDIGYQAWVKPAIEGLGALQVILASGGGDTGGIAITEEGNWAHLSASVEGVKVRDTGVPVVFGQWANVATVIVGDGNSTQMFVNGALVNLNGDASLGTRDGSMSIGVRDATGANAFVGAVDDLRMMVTSVLVGGFAPEFDLDVFEDALFSGVVGDVDQDGTVGISDYNIWAANVGFRNGLGAGDPGTLLMGDVDRNGSIDLADFSLIKAQAAAAGVVIPEPASLVMLGIGATMIVRRRRGMGC